MECLEKDSSLLSHGEFPQPGPDEPHCRAQVKNHWSHFSGAVPAFSVSIFLNVFEWNEGVERNFAGRLSHKCSAVYQCNPKFESRSPDEFWGNSGCDVSAANPDQKSLIAFC